MARLFSQRNRTDTQRVPARARCGALMVLAVAAVLYMCAAPSSSFANSAPLVKADAAVASGSAAAAHAAPTAEQGASEAEQGVSALGDDCAAQQVNLKDYVLSRSLGAEDPAAFSEVLVNAEGTRVAQDEDGAYVVCEGAAYAWEVNLSAPAGIAQGTYVYELPQGVTARSLEQSEVTTVDKASIGTLEMGEEGRCICLRMSENTERNLHVKITAAVDLARDAESGSVYRFAVPDPGSTQAHSDAQRPSGVDGSAAADAALPVGGEGGGVSAESADVRAHGSAADEIELEQYVMSRGFGSEEPGFLVTLVDANGNPVPQENGMYQLYEGQSYYYHLNVYAPAGIPDAGRYYYALPEGVSVADTLHFPVTANDGTQVGTLTADENGSVVYLDMEDNSKIRLRLQVDIAMTVELDEDGIPVNTAFELVTDDNPQIEKSGKITSDGELAWAITAFVPKWNGNEDDYVTWSFNDAAYSEVTGHDYYPDLSRAEITIAVSGSTKPLHAVEDADALGETMAYFWEAAEQNSRLYLVVKHDGSHTCENNLDGQLPDGWCTDWNIESDAVIEISYVDPDFNLSDAERADEGASIYNEARIFRDNRSTETEAEVPVPSIIEKSPLQNGTFTITVNEGSIDLSKHETVTIRDAMSENLVYRRGSISAEATDADGVVQSLTYGQDYTLTVSEDLHRLEITLLHPGPYRYTIVYGVMVTATGESPYTNTAAVEAFGQEFEDVSTGTTVSATADEYALRAHKTDADTAEPVEGATYGLFSQHGELLTTAVSDASGNMAFAGNPSAGFILASNYLYYLQETDAPDGYQLSDARYWFYYDDSDQSVISALTDEAQLEGRYHEGEPLTAVANHGYTDEAQGNGGGSADELAVPIEVTDKKRAFELPETGGFGTTPLTMGGITALVLASLGHMSRWRKEGRR